MENTIINLEGEWKAGNREGKGKQIYKNGDFYDGEWKADNREGTGIYIYRDGKIEEGEFKTNEFVKNCKIF